jgi:hypothetical protein
LAFLLQRLKGGGGGGGGVKGYSKGVPNAVKFAPIVGLFREGDEKSLLNFFFFFFSVIEEEGVHIWRFCSKG